MGREDQVSGSGQLSPTGQCATLASGSNSDGSSSGELDTSHCLAWSQQGLEKSTIKMRRPLWSPAGGPRPR